MPLMKCEVDGAPGWQYGTAGKCYTYAAGDDASEAAAKKKAIKQAIAIGGGKPPAEGLSELYRLAESAKAGERIPMMLFPIGIWKSAKYPKLSLTRELAEAVIANFEANVLGTEPVVDSSGKHDTAAEAAGWIKDLRIAPTKDGGEALYADWEPTDLGAAQLNEKRYQYNSVEIGEVVDNATGVKTTNVLRSVTLTNTPILRMLPPVLEAGEAIAASEPIEVALSELEPVDPVTGLIDDIDTLLAKLDDNLKGKAGIRAMRTYLRETKTKVAAHTLAEDPSEFTPPEPSPSGGATGETFVDGTCAEGVGGNTTHPKEKKQMSELTQLLKLSEDADEALVLAEVKRVMGKNAALEAKFAESEKAERARKLDEAITATEVLPAEKDRLLKLAESVPEAFDDDLVARKGVKLVDLAVHGDGKTPADKTPPEDVTVELAEAAKELAAKRGISEAEAQIVVLSEDADLSSRYANRDL
jgi:hypothetical protein